MYKAMIWTLICAVASITLVSKLVQLIRLTNICLYMVVCVPSMATLHIVLV